MSANVLKKLLLTGTAIVAVSAFAAPAHATVIVNGGNETVAGNVTDDPAVAFWTNHTAIINNNVDLSHDGSGYAVINDTGSDWQGTLTFQGNSTVTGDVGLGGEGYGLAAINANGNASKTVTINGDVVSQSVNIGAGALDINGDLDFNTINFTADGSLSVTGYVGDDDSGNIINDAGAANMGTVTFLGGSYVSGTVGIGGDGALKTLNIGGSGNINYFGDDVAAQTINVSGNGGEGFVYFSEGDITGNVRFLGENDVVLGGEGDSQTITGNVTNISGASGVGTLVLYTDIFNTGGTVEVTGTIGVGGNGALNEVDVIGGEGGGVDSTVTFDGNVVANDIYTNTVGDIHFKGNVTGDIYLDDNATITIDDGKNITGDIDADGTLGTLILSGSTTVDGDIGFNDGALSEIRLGADESTSTFTGIVEANNINMTGDGTAVFENGFTGDFNFGGYDGTLQLDGGTVTGDIFAGTEYDEDAEEWPSAGYVDVTNDTTLAGSIGGEGGAIKSVTVEANQTLTVDMTDATRVINTDSLLLNGNEEDGDATLSFFNDLGGEGLTIIPNGIQTATDGNGILSAGGEGNGTVFVLGDIGSDDYRLKEINFGDGTGDQDLVATGDVYANAITLAGGSTLALIGSGDQTVSGTVDGAGDDQGDVYLGGEGDPKTVTFDSNVGWDNLLRDLDVGEDVTADFQGHVGFDGDVDNDGTINIHDGKDLWIGDDLINNAGATFNLLGTGGEGQVNDDLTNNGTLRIDAGRSLWVWGSHIASDEGANAVYDFGLVGGNDPSNGFLFVDDSGINLTDATVGVHFSPGNGYTPNHTLFNVAYGNDGNVIGAGTVEDVAFGNTSRITFKYADGGTIDDAYFDGDEGLSNADLYVIALRNDLKDIADLTGNDRSLAGMLDDVGGDGGETMQEIQDLVDGAGEGTDDGKDLHGILERLEPTADGSNTIPVLEVDDLVKDVTDTRMAALRSGDGLSGMAAGAAGHGMGMWLQGYGQTAKQDARGGVKGYDSDTMGVAVGFDSANLNGGKSVVGVALSYSKTNADSKNLNTTSTDIDHYGVTLYGTHDLGNQVFVNGQLGYAYNDLTIDRHNVVPDSLTAHGSTNSDQYSAKLAVGRDYTGGYGMTVTPSLSASYVYVDTASYTETGSLGSLYQDPDSVSALDLGVSFKAQWKLQANGTGNVLKPAIHAGYAYNAINDKVQITSGFVEDTTGSSFVTEGPSPSRHKYNAGAGLVYSTSANWDLSANYDYSFRSDYKAHNGMLRATSHF